jgi:hypothetical protein
MLGPSLRGRDIDFNFGRIKGAGRGRTYEDDEKSSEAEYDERECQGREALFVDCET